MPRNRQGGAILSRQRSRANKGGRAARQPRAAGRCGLPACRCCGVHTGRRRCREARTGPPPGCWRPGVQAGSVGLLTQGTPWRRLQGV